MFNQKRLLLFKTLTYTACAFLIVIALILGYLYSMAKYEAIKKFYPDITFHDYVMLGDKLRITPNGD